MNQRFFQALSEIDMASVPGECELSNFGSTNGEALGMKDGKLNLDRVNFLFQCVLARAERLSQRPEADPLKVFIKPEPHKIEKILDGRLRLIAGVSLVDTMVDRILFGQVFREVLKTAGKTDIMIGWNVFNHGSALLQRMLGKHKRYLAIDKKHWDWSCPYWLLEEFRELLKILMPGASQHFYTMIDNRFDALFKEAVFSFGGDVRIKQKGEGILKSGWFLTIFFNSFGQTYLHDLAEMKMGIDLPRALAMGDDVVSGYFEDWETYSGILENMGFINKLKITEKPEFCGFSFDGVAFYPEYSEKHNFLLNHLTLDDEIAAQTLQGYQLMYFFDTEKKEVFRQLARERGLPRAVVDDTCLRGIVMG